MGVFCWVFGVYQEIFRYTTSGAAFGELSLIYGEKRAATVRALTGGALWVLDRKAFRGVMMRRSGGSLLQALRGVPSLEGTMMSTHLLVIVHSHILFHNLSHTSSDSLTSSCPSLTPSLASFSPR